MLREMKKTAKDLDMELGSLIRKHVDHLPVESGDTSECCSWQVELYKKVIRHTLGKVWDKVAVQICQEIIQQRLNEHHRAQIFHLLQPEQ